MNAKDQHKQAIKNIKIQVKMILNGILLAGRVFLSCVQRTLQAKGKVMTLNLKRGFYFPFFFCM